MTENSLPQPPPTGAWVAAVHASEEDFEPLGSAVVIAADQVLTCAHVVMAEGVVRERLSVAFPKAGGCPRRRVAGVRFAYARPVRDVAVLMLEEPVPAGVEPAPLRFPGEDGLVGRGWWAFGFPDRDPVGDSAGGQVGTALSYGWVRLDTRSQSRYLIRPGFSGAGLWSPDYQAVVGIVGQAHANGDGRAITLHRADLDLPEVQLRILGKWSAEAAGEVALTQWGWALDRDPEGTRHWRPRARGVSIDSEQGWRFRGRTAALRTITSWLVRDVIDRRVLVVTGAPGAGKSAVLGRIVITADANAVHEIPASDTAIRAKVGSVACAVHAKGQTALQTATQIAKAASAALPERLDDFAPALRDALTVRGGTRFNVVIDALDEAATAAEARLVVSKVILPLAETCAEIGAQVIVSSRRSDGDGDLLGAFGGAARLVDLDRPQFFAEEDLAAYALATLQLAGDEHPGNPYADDEAAATVAQRIAALSDGNFLVAGLTARTHGLYDETPADPAALSFSPKVDDAMREYLKRIPPVGNVSAETLLTALAFAESPGLPVNLWRAAVRALGSGDVTEATLLEFAGSSAANFLVESSEADDAGDAGDAGTVFRLFHQALNDALLNARPKLVTERERSLTRTFMAVGRETGWDHAPDYLLRSLPGHAARVSLMDDLLADDDYLLHADLLRVQPLASHATSQIGRERERLLRLSPRDILTASPESRAGIFSITEALEGLPNAYTRTTIRTPYRAAWAAVPQSNERSVLRSPDNDIRSVEDICTFRLGANTLLAATEFAIADGDSRGTLRIWDPITGTPIRALGVDQEAIHAVCPVTLNGTIYLAIAISDGTIRTWDPADGTELHTFAGDNPIYAACALTLNGTAHLATAVSDGAIQIWNLATGNRLRTLLGHKAPVHALCSFLANGTTYLATGGNDRTVRIWDPATGVHQGTLTGHKGRVDTVCAFTLNNSTLLAAASNDRTVRIWNPATGAHLRTLTGHERGIRTVCAFIMNGTTLLATGGRDGTVWIWDPATGTHQGTFTGHAFAVFAICAFTLDGTPHLATASSDHTVRIWNASAASTVPIRATHHAQVGAACAFTVNGGTHLATGGGDCTVRFWDPATGTHLRTLTGHASSVTDICAFTLDGTTHLATTSFDGTLRIWDPVTGTCLRALTVYSHGVWAVCAFTRDGTPHLATGGDDDVVQIWDPATGTHLRTLTGHESGINSVCAFTVNGTVLLAGAGQDRAIRIWDPATCTQLRTLTGHDAPVADICAFTLHDRTYLASASNDRTARIWDAATGIQVRILANHKDMVGAICAFTLNGTTYLATGGSDGVVRISDPTKEGSALIIPTRDSVWSVAHADGVLFAGMATGVLAIRLDPDSLQHSLG